MHSIPGEVRNWIAEKLPESIPQDYRLAGKNQFIRLFVNSKNGSIIVLDDRSGSKWSSVPEDAASNKNFAGVWKRRSPIPLTIEYTGADRTSIKVVRPEDIKLRVTPLDNGARVDVDVPNNGFSLSMYYLLSNDAINVMIPNDSIKETAENGLVSLQILPFFGAKPDDSSGYMIYPDGSGMLVRFSSQHRDEVQETSRPIYGDDLLSPPTAQINAFNRFALAMPVFGLTTGSDGYIGIITHGDFDASLSLSRSGKGMPYNRVWGNFIFRRQGMFSLNSEQPVILYQPDRINADRQIRYVFVTGKADYSALAAKFREYLIERGAKRLTANNLPLMNLHFFMGVEQRTWFLRDFIRMTDFKDVQNIVSGLYAKNISKLDVTLEGWNNGGANAHYPQRLPVETQLGGEADLRSLSNLIHSFGQHLYLLDNYLDILPGADGVYPIMDSVRGVDGLPVGDSEKGYYLNPQVALRQFAARDLPLISKLGVDGLYLQDFAAKTAPDANLRYPLNRESFAGTWMQIAAMARNQFGNVSMDGPNLYAVNFADRLENVPLQGTGYDLSDESIPFYQIAVHGLVQYSGSPINLSSDAKNSFLHHLEYGAIPVFLLTQNDTTNLFHTETNQLWTGQYAAWQNEIIREYSELNGLSVLQTQFIERHEKLTDGVYKITYEKGIQIIVNYNDFDYVDGDHKTSPKSFSVIFP